jgi:hypothetical protein
LEYLGDKEAFLCARYKVDREQFRKWYDAWMTPSCTAQVRPGVDCDEQVNIPDEPIEFRPGISDRCARHQAANN